jgi:hypothetical protein
LTRSSNIQTGHVERAKLIGEEDVQATTTQCRQWSAGWKLVKNIMPDTLTITTVGGKSEGTKEPETGFKLDAIVSGRG